MDKSITDRMYTKTSYDETRFYQLPKALMENKQYSKVSMSAKLMYSIMRDRQDLSIKNQWLDEEGRIYFYYDCRALSELCNVSTSTINRYKKELIESKLLINVRQGLNKPNRLYILKPESVENTRSSHSDYTGIVKTTTQEVSKRLQNDTEFNDTELSETEYIHLSENTKDDFLLFYIKTFKEYKNKNHTRVTVDNLDYILSVIEELRFNDIDIDEWEESVIEHFNNLPNSNNGNILAFLKASKRYFEADLDEL